ncbi:hypothetical protein Hanom_Chr17g01587601 [Helianthus anomalus]
MCPPTKQTNTIPLLQDLPDNSLQDFMFWMYDLVSGQVVIFCKHDEYRVVDFRDLMRFGEKDIHLLGRSQIQSDPQYKICAKSFLARIAQIILFRMWYVQRGRVKTQLFCPYIGNKIPDVQ